MLLEYEHIAPGVTGDPAMRSARHDQLRTIVLRTQSWPANRAWTM